MVLRLYFDPVPPISTEARSRWRGPRTPSASPDSQMKEKVLARIADRSATVGVIGLGYVGLPLAVEFARAGFKVIGFDVSQRVCDLLNSGKSHIQDVPSAEVEEFVKSGH